MSDMRLIVAGAGGRMGRALIRAIDETPGAVVAGALGCSVPQPKSQLVIIVTLSAVITLLFMVASP